VAAAVGACLAQHQDREHQPAQSSDQGAAEGDGGGTGFAPARPEIQKEVALAVGHSRPAFCAYMKAAFASGRMRAIICVACALAAVPSRTRPAMPCRIAARRKAL